VVCVEAKAGEDLGATIAQQTKLAAAAEENAEQERVKTRRASTSNAPARIQALLARFVPYPPSDPRVQALRYQLLTALAGTLSEAKTTQARHAVLMLHDFLTDQRPVDVAEHDRDLHRFCATLFDLEPPAAAHAPWCIELPAIADTPEVALYLALAVTDLRASTLEHPTSQRAVQA
jgi:hypothetical protein